MSYTGPLQAGTPMSRRYPVSSLSPPTGVSGVVVRARLPVADRLSPQPALQKFEYYGRKTWRRSSGSVDYVALPLNKILAKNLRFFMDQPGCAYRNANSLSQVSGVSANTIRNILTPSKRTVTSDKPEGYPVLDILEKLASHLKCQTWELLHPDIQKSLREREMYRNIVKTIPALRGIRESEKDDD